MFSSSVLAGIYDQQVSAPVVIGGGGSVTTIGSITDFRNNAGSRDIDFSGIAYQADDVAIINISCDAFQASHSISFSEPGWEPNLFIDSQPLPGGPRNMQIFQFAKVMNAVEPVTQITNTQTGSTEQWGYSLQVKRGVDTVNIFDVPYDESLHVDIDVNNSTPSNKPITTLTPNAEVNILHGWNATTNISVVRIPNSPAGLVAGQHQLGNTNIRFAHAYLPDAGAPGVVSPGPWEHTHSNEQDYWLLTYALRSKP